MYHSIFHSKYKFFNGNYFVVMVRVSLACWLTILVPLCGENCLHLYYYMVLVLFSLTFDFPLKSSYEVAPRSDSEESGSEFEEEVSAFVINEHTQWGVLALSTLYFIVQ